MVGSDIHDAFQQAGARLVLPSADMPHVMPCPMAWRPHDLEKKPPIINLDLNMLAEVLQALAYFKAIGTDGQDVGQENFPLPTLAAYLDRASDNIHSGTGFAIVRGLDLSNLTPEDQLVVFLGLASFIGDVRGVQDKRGTMISHITDSQMWAKVPRELRHGIHTNSGLAWHNDMTVDVLALHVRAVAEKGGRTLLSSSWTMYQDLLATRPDIISILSEPAWPLQVSGTPPRFILAPLLQVYKDRILFSVDPGRLGLHPVTSQYERGCTTYELRPSQREALDVVAELATQNSYAIDSKPGDMVFINNLSLLHAREPYFDSSATSQRRHLVRLWLRNSERAWEIPQSMKAPWEAAFGPKGDGNPLFLTDTKGPHKMEIVKHYPVLEAPVYKVPRYSAGSAAFVLEDDDNDGNARGD